MWHVWGQDRGRQLWLEDPKKRDHLKDPGVDGRIILKWISKK